jgi:prevent-host-death family protein
MKTSTVAHAKAHFSALISAVVNGEEVMVTRRGQPVARIVPPEQPPQAFDLTALRAYLAAAPERPGPSVADLRKTDQL